MRRVLGVNEDVSPEIVEGDDNSRLREMRRRTNGVGDGLAFGGYTGLTVPFNGCTIRDVGDEPVISFH
jgi:hypothetical protein